MRWDESVTYLFLEEVNSTLDDVSLQWLIVVLVVALNDVIRGCPRGIPRSDVTGQRLVR